MNPNGILSTSDKEYLASKAPTGPNDLWTGNEPQKRLRMRKKIQAAILDFPLLSGLPRKEYELIFKDLKFDQNNQIEVQESLVEEMTDGESNTPAYRNISQYRALQHMLAFIYNACQVEPAVNFESLLEGAIMMEDYKWLDGEAPETRSVHNVDVAIDVIYRDRPDVEKIKEKLAGDGKVTLSEIGELYLQGELDDQELSLSDLDPQIFLSEGSR